jgi:hypothetical protein
MAILPNLASTRLPTLAEAATIGNPQGQATQASELARLLGQYQQTQANLERAQELQGAQYIPNSGALGVLSSLASQFMGGRLRRKEGETAAELTQRILAEQARAENEKALAEENKKAAADRAKIAERIAIARRGDPAELSAYGIELPKQPQQEYSLYDGADGPVWIPKPMGQPSGQPQGMTTPQTLGEDFLPSLEASVRQVESGGDPNAISPKGAIGTMQTMPSTLRDPGFGVQPARDNSPAELERVGKDYLGAMLNKYGDPRLALAAYNWGPGNVDKAIQQTGGNPDAVLAIAPAETRNYVPKVLAGAQMPGRPGGVSAIPVAGVRPKPKDSVPRMTTRQLSPEETTAAGYAPGTVVQERSDGVRSVVQSPRPAGATGAPKPLSVEAANKVGLYDNAIRAARGYLDLVGEKDENGNFTGGYNNIAAATPEAQRLLTQAVRAKLRAESGASISPAELEGEVDRYGAKLLGSDATDLQGATALLKDLTVQRQSLSGPAKSAAVANQGAQSTPGTIRYDAQGNRL